MTFPMSRAIQTFIVEPIRLRRFGLAWYRLSQLLHDRTNGLFDLAYVRIAAWLRPKVALPKPSGMTDAQIADTVAQLKNSGFAPLPLRLSLQEIEALRRFAYETPAHGTDYNGKIVLSAAHIPPGEPRYNWWMHELVRQPVVQRLLTEGPYCRIAQDYLGCRPTLAHVTLFLDQLHPVTYGPHTYHYDNEGPAFLKFFFYLTDVDTETGAHHFIRGSHGHSKPKRFARATFYTDDDLLDHYGHDKELVIEGPAGTVFAEDTAGFHRGSAIERDHRIVLQFEFSILDVPTEHELRRPLHPVAVPGLDPGIAKIADKFFVAKAP